MFTEELSRFITGTGYEDLPREVVDAAKLAILDHIGVTLAGSREPVAEIINELVRENDACAEATIIGSGLKASRPLAALANGTMAHALDYDDCMDFPSVALGHPTTAILPAALAVGEKLNASGRDLIAAYCLGMEAYIKVGLLVGEALQRGWVRTSVFGVIGAAASVARLLGLDEARVVSCFGITASLAGGISRNFGTMVNPLHAGNAARNGVEAALLSSKGFTSWTGIFESPGGFCNIFSGSQDNISEKTMNELINALGNPWNIISPGLMFKVYPCAHISHFGVDAALNLRREHSIDWQQISEIEFRVPHGLQGGSYRQPQTGLEGKFSPGYCLSRAFIDGSVRLRDFTDDKVNEPSIKQLIGKINWSAIGDPTAGGVFGAQEVEVKLNDGSSYTCRIEHPSGEPENPASEEDIIGKFEDCAAYALFDKKAASQIKELVLNLDEVESVSQLTGLIGRP